MFKKNPVKLPDGTWESYPGSAQIAFSVLAEYKDAFLEAVHDKWREIDPESAVEVC
jgi:hypothetical protein